MDALARPAIGVQVDESMVPMESQIHHHEATWPVSDPDPFFLGLAGGFAIAQDRAAQPIPQSSRLRPGMSRIARCVCYLISEFLCRICSCSKTQGSGGACAKPPI